MIKKIIIIGAILILLTLIIFVFITTNRDKPVTGLTPKEPDIKSSITGALPITISVKEDDFDFPLELPMISVSLRNLDKDTIRSMAGKLGMGTGLNEFEDVNEGIKYYTDTDSFFFTATPKTATIKYGMVTSGIPKATNKNIRDQEITKLAMEFIVSNGFYKENEIEALPIIYLKTGTGSEEIQKTSRNTAEIFQVGFTIKNGKYEIVRENNEGHQIFVQILPDGSVYNAEIFLINNVVESVSKYPIKSYDDLVANIGKAKIISLEGDYISTSDLTLNDLSNLNIEKIRIVYYLETNKQDSLQPIFILEGSAKITKSPANFATLYLPAYK